MFLFLLLFLLFLVLLKDDRRIFTTFEAEVNDFSSEVSFDFLLLISGSHVFGSIVTLEDFLLELLVKFLFSDTEDLSSLSLREEQMM